LRSCLEHAGNLKPLIESNRHDGSLAGQGSITGQSSAVTIEGWFDLNADSCCFSRPCHC
jgi:hypothetical protein